MASDLPGAHPIAWRATGQGTKHLCGNTSMESTDTADYITDVNMSGKITLQNQGCLPVQCLTRVTLTGNGCLR